MQFIETNKAKITIDESHVIKEFFSSGLFHKEANNLAVLNRIMPGLEHEGWYYGSVKIISIDYEHITIVMEKAEGQQLQRLFVEVPEVCMKAGIWLAYFHKKACDAKGLNLLYTDYNLSNIIIDRANNKVMVIDPGASFGSIGVPGQDILDHTLSLIISSVKQFKFPGTFITFFLKGYTIVGKFEFNAAEYNAFTDVFFKRMAKLRRGSSVRQLFNKILVYLLRLYLICFVYPKFEKYAN